MNNETYRGYNIVFARKPGLGHDWDWAVEDWDLDDPRCGTDATREAAMESVDEMIEEYGE